MKLNTDKGEVLIRDILFTNNMTYNFFLRLIDTSEFLPETITENPNRKEYKYIEKNDIYSIVFEENILSYIMIERTNGDLDWESYAASKIIRIEKTKQILIDFGLEHENNFSWGNISFEYDPRNLSPYILIQFKAPFVEKKSRFLI